MRTQLNGTVLHAVVEEDGIWREEARWPSSATVHVATWRAGAGGQATEESCTIDRRACRRCVLKCNHDNICNGTASARTSDPGASIGSWAVRFGWRELISRRSRCEASKCCEQLFRCCEELFPCCELSSLQHSTNDVASVLRTCSEHVANEVTCNIQTSGVFLSPPPHMLRPCSDYVATMLWPVMRATSNIRSPPPPPPWHNTNITCLQHRNSTFATFTKSQWNIKMHMSQHVRVADETRGTKCCNIIKTTTHVACNIQHQALPLLLDTQTSHVCNIETQLKLNVCNTQQHLSATSRLSIYNIKN
jgi:hypothetical protein